MFDPVAFAEAFHTDGGFASAAALFSSECAFDDSFDAAFDVCSADAGDTGGRGGRRRITIPAPFEDPDELLALI